MTTTPLSTDATIAYVAGKLNKPAEYVRRVLENMWECKRAFGSALVRIGVMGEGRAPNYRLEYSKEGLSFPAVFRVQEFADPAPPTLRSGRPKKQPGGRY